MNRIYRISNGVRKESHRHPVHPVNPVKIPLRFISVTVWRTRPPEKRKFLRKSQLWSEDFTAKLFCNVEFWLERLPKLIEHQPEFQRPVSAGGDGLLPRTRPAG